MGKPPFLFRNREHAGLLLAQHLQATLQEQDAVIVGLARGGVPVASEVARYLHLPLHVLVVRKLGYPKQPELAFGAIAPGDIIVLNRDILAERPLSEEIMLEIAREQKQLLSQRMHAYHLHENSAELKGKIAVLVDDGLATGATLRAGLAWAQRQGAEKRIIAVPVASPNSCQHFMELKECDACLCLNEPKDFQSVGAYYEKFGQVSDEEVQNCMRN